MSVNYTQLLTYLRENQDLCISEAEWSGLSDTAYGVGGVSYYVLDETADTVRLPDTRGDYLRAYHPGFATEILNEEYPGGGDVPALNIGEWHKDAARNVTGYLKYIYMSDPYTSDEEVVGGCFKRVSSAGNRPGGSTHSRSEIYMDNSNVVLTSNENRPRTIALLPCVYIGEY